MPFTQAMPVRWHASSRDRAPVHAGGLCGGTPSRRGMHAPATFSRATVAASGAASGQIHRHFLPRTPLLYRATVATGTEYLTVTVALCYSAVMREYEPGQGAEELQPDQTSEEQRRHTAGDEPGRSRSIEELAQQVGVSPRTVRFYIGEGLLSGPGSRGKAATYGDEHLLRLRLIRRLTERHVPLSDVRDLLGRLSNDEARTLLAQEDQHATELERAARSPSPQQYVAKLLGQARAAQQGAAQRAASPALPPAPSPVPTQERPHRLAAYAAASPQPPMQVRETSGQAGAPESEPATWQRYELAPGLELHVSAGAMERYRDLIARLLRLAGASDTRPGG